MNYWIMKTEPDEFSIEDLEKRPLQTENWNGVRNYQSRNFLKSMNKGDKVLLYHSSCKIPGVAGLATVSRCAYPDHTALDKKSKYFDPGHSEAKPRWFQVDITFVEKFKNFVSLEDLRKHPELKELIILRKGNRLSITPITKKEFEFILKLK